jgi:hypothetical protein
VVLPVAPQAAEPDDGAYRASIVAITDGHFLTLSIAQAKNLARELGDNPTDRRGRRLDDPLGARFDVDVKVTLDCDR